MHLFLLCYIKVWWIEISHFSLTNNGNTINQTSEENKATLHGKSTTFMSQAKRKGLQRSKLQEHRVEVSVRAWKKVKKKGGDWSYLFLIEQSKSNHYYAQITISSSIILIFGMDTIEFTLEFYSCDFQKKNNNC